jgi:phosphoribosylanthranilate isomerase
MFRIKICGITTVQDMQRVVTAGADAVGLNLCPSSPRYVAADRALAIVDAVPDQIAKVGVFVNSPSDEILALGHALALDWIQLHGDEPPEFLGQLGDRAVIRAFRCGPRGIEPVADYLDECRRQSRLPQAVLIDAHVPGQYGGTGQVVRWDQVAEPRPWLLGLPLILAGGLTPGNVATAIAAVHPAAVDTASGVEAAPGRKDPELVGQFVKQATAAFDRLKA